LIREIMDFCAGIGAKLWAPGVILAPLEKEARLAMMDKGISRDQAVEHTAALMRDLLERVDILSLAGHEQREIFQFSKDYETAQISASARAISSGETAIVTTMENFDTLGEAQALRPAQALDWLKSEDQSSAANMAFIDLAAQQGFIRSHLESRIEKALRHGRYVLGPETIELEERLARFVGVKHCLGVSSGTDALLIALMALGVGPGDEVITSPFSFIATAEVIALLGAKPVFVDIDPHTFNIKADNLIPAVTGYTKAVVPISLYGQCPDFDKIKESIPPHDTPLIEDAAQSFGATYKGLRSCSYAQMAATSFFPAKPLGGYGEGGALFTDDDELADIIRRIRAHGETARYEHARLGLNARLDSLQAAVILAKLERLDWEIERRADLGARYTELLREIPGVTPPFIESFCTSVFAQYTIRVSDRARLQNALKEANIPYAIHYPNPLHLQPVFKSLGYKDGDFPEAERAAKEVMSLPMSPYLTEKQQDEIVEVIRNTFKDRR
jgi:UDP-2-acetamido-2-deoxy-ribo-hexuluronate aminotransferase